MSDYVWVSDAIRDSEPLIPVETDIVQADLDAAIEGGNLWREGKSVPPELCPKRIWARDDVEDYRRMPETLPDLFYARTQWIVSARAAEVLRQFDLGGGALYPVTEGVYREDNATPVPGDFFCWIFGNMKTAFLPDETPEKRKFGVSGTRWKMPWNMVDDNIAVSSEALTGPDVWLDSILFQALFLSRALGDSLDAIGLCKTFRLSKARVI